MKTRSLVLRLSPWRVLGWRMAARYGFMAFVMTSLVALTVVSAVLAKEARWAQPLAEIEVVQASPAGSVVPVLSQRRFEEQSPEPAIDPASIAPVSASTNPAEAVDASRVFPEGTRFFDGRPIRPVKTILMTVTAYSPDWRSCGPDARGITATLHHVSTNAHKLVAADPRVLPYGSLLTIPGYDSAKVVPVLDCGGAIKGNRLDVLFPTHEEARAWGVRKIRVTVWDYADGKPRENVRKLR